MTASSQNPEPLAIQNTIPELTVAVCAWNAVTRLRPTLEHLARQKTPPQLVWEILYIDNNSSDGSSALAAALWDQLGSVVPLRIILEPKQGVAYARERAICESRSRLLLFCDDDNWLRNDYIANAVKIMRSHSQIGAVGGWSEAIVDKGLEVPKWFPWVQEGFAVGRQASANGDVSARGFLWGAGICIRREPLEAAFKLGVRPILGGRSGHSSEAGEDSEYCKWLLLLGFKLYYSDQLHFKHRLQANRITPEYRDAIFKGFWEAERVTSVYDAAIKIRRRASCGGDARSSLFFILRVLRKARLRRVQLSRLGRIALNLHRLRAVERQLGSRDGAACDCSANGASTDAARSCR